MKKHKNPPFVMVTNQVLDSPAWRAMSMGARCLYVALKRRCPPNRHNNGRIRLSLREAREQLGACFTQITRWFAELQYYGFIVMMEAGCLGLDGKGKAPSWRLTEVAYMRGTSSKGMEDMPTMDFLKWNGIPFSNHHRGGDHLKPRKANGDTEPWETAGMSRASWYRHGRPSAEVGRSRIPERPSEHLAETSETESRSRKPERDAPENWSASGNNRFGKPEHMSHETAPENRNISYKPSGVGGRGVVEGSSRDPPQPPVSEAPSPRGNGHDAVPAPEPTPAEVKRCARCGEPITPSPPPSWILDEDRTCVQCRGPVDGKENLVAFGNGPSVWLHRQCEKFYLQARCLYCGNPADAHRGAVTKDQSGFLFHDGCRREAQLQAIEDLRAAGAPC
jgi:hypothetical protein